jgi:hypothetical protein
LVNFSLQLKLVGSPELENIKSSTRQQPVIPTSHSPLPGLESNDVLPLGLQIGEALTSA